MNEFTFIVSWDLKSGFCHLHAYSVGCNDSRSTSECNVCFMALSDCGSFLKYIITGSGGNRNSDTVVSTMFQSQYIRDLLPPATKLQQGNVLHLSVILFRGVSATPPWADTPLPSACWDTHTPAQCMLGYTSPPAQCMLGSTLPLCSTCWDTVNKWVVRIPLECILVLMCDHT